MDPDIQAVEERLKSFLAQIQVECGIFDRIVYKNKNQHRRCLYFQYLLKVRRDLRLLQSAQLDDVLNSSFQVIHGSRPKQKVQLLESLKRRKRDGGKYNFLERLKGAARLLSQMVEPMLKAATDISTVLARSFFMGFSVIVLALLARLRVLVQQMLVDIVKVYNLVSSLTQKEQSVKLSQDGFEVFREYYPIHEEIVLLECVWETDKFVLHEKSNKSQTKRPDRDLEEVPIGASTIQYQSVEAFLGVDESVGVNPTEPPEDLTCTSAHNASSPADQDVANNDGKQQVDSNSLMQDSSAVGSPKTSPPSETCLDAGLSSYPTLDPQKHKSGLKAKVAFISIGKPAMKKKTVEELDVKTTENPSDDKEDPFFSLLTGNQKGSIF